MKKVIFKVVLYRKSQIFLVYNILIWELLQSGLVLIYVVSYFNEVFLKNKDLFICDIKIIENLYMYVVYFNKYIVF